MELDPNAYVNVDFKNVRWSGVGQPSIFSRLVKINFLLDDDKKLFKHDDMKDILAAWLCDEFKLHPIDFDFIIAP